MKRFVLLFLVIVCYFHGFSATVDVRLIISNGQLNLPGGIQVDAKTFSESTTFQKSSDILIWQTGDEINLRVVNFDTAPHRFVIETLADYGIIPAGDSVEQTITLSSTGVFRYSDPTNFPFNQYLGLNGVIHVKSMTDVTPYFYWDIREVDSSWNNSLSLGANPSLSDYDPTFFLINGNSNPNIDQDQLAKVTGTVGNEFKIILVNNGVSIHSMHFHGFHLLIEQDSKSNLNLGRIKDTFPLYPKEFIVLSCIPDKEGEYPVHDHNLVAVTGNLTYANGMFTTMIISP